VSERRRPNSQGNQEARPSRETVRLEKILSGGQTGVDRAALDVAMALNIPCSGWCPRGRRAEDGRIPDRYPLQETARPSYSSRTIQNVIDSDGTLILALGRLTGGTLLTKNTAHSRRKSWLFVDLHGSPDVTVVQNWLGENEIRVLNVAGPRASQAPGIYSLATSFLLRLLSHSLRPPSCSTDSAPGRTRHAKGEASRQTPRSPHSTKKSKASLRRAR